MTDFETQTSITRKKLISKTISEECCLKNCFFSSNPNFNQKTHKQNKLDKRKKITLLTSESSQYSKNGSKLEISKRRSITPITQPELPRGSSIERLISSVSKFDQPIRRSCIIGSQNLKPKVTIHIQTKTNKTSNIPVSVPKPQYNILTYSSVNTNASDKNKPSLNAIKTSKININPLIISRPSSVMKVSYQPSVNVKQKYYQKSFYDQKSLASTKNLSAFPSVLYQSVAEPTINLELESKTRIDQIESKKYSFEPVSQQSSPRLYQSYVSYSDCPSFTQNNTSEVILKIPVMGAKTQLLPEDLRRGNSFIKKKNQKGNIRTMTFAEQGTSDISGDVSKEQSEDDKLSITPRQYKRLNSFDEYFNRGGFIGSGRTSTVYIVQQKKNKLVLASKQIFKKIIYHNNTQTDINKDIQKHMRLPYHKNVVSLYVIFQDTSRYYFVTQLCSTNLRSVMKQKLSEDQAIQYLKNILQGVQFLHNNKIVHKHIKPQNILISYNSCKISDFGWADKLLLVNNHYPNYQYSSPQMANNVNLVDYKTDCWSIGIIAYQMVFGELPLDSAENIILKNKNNIQKLSKRYTNLLEGLLNIDPINRYSASKALQILSQQTIYKPNIDQIKLLMS